MSSTLKQIGIHIRLTDTINHVIEKAIRLNLQIFQTFAVTDQGKEIRFTDSEKEQFIKLRQKHFNNLYLHSSYWINLSRENKRSYRTLLRELQTAKDFEFTHFILHPGAGLANTSKEDNIQILANNLNNALNEFSDVEIVLENTAHGGNSIGSDLQDFKLLMPKIEQPEKISFCLDTSHAYAYGYDISDVEYQKDFLQLLDSTMGLNKIKLIHLNDTSDPLGALIDRHLAPGTGRIGSDALKSLVNQPELKNVPIIMELPKLEETQELDLVKELKKW